MSKARLSLNACRRRVLPMTTLFYCFGLPWRRDASRHSQTHPGRPRVDHFPRAEGETRGIQKDQPAGFTVRTCAPCSRGSGRPPATATEHLFSARAPEPRCPETAHSCTQAIAGQPPSQLPMSPPLSRPLPGSPLSTVRWLSPVRLANTVAMQAVAEARALQRLSTLL